MRTIQLYALCPRTVTPLPILNLKRNKMPVSALRDMTPTFSPMCRVWLSSLFLSRASQFFINTNLSIITCLLREKMYRTNALRKLNTVVQLQRARQEISYRHNRKCQSVPMSKLNPGHWRMRKTNICNHATRQGLLYGGPPVTRLDVIGLPCHMSRFIITQKYMESFEVPSIFLTNIYLEKREKVVKFGGK